ncbi:sigma factor-like helix-turn-helix DNA-binding protein [Bradyrhizobium viridifuturi]|uniref:sigma factor-like helix-turn-helix DNA-binding protein n=1 Tax=Bradyrhizobium viridifuturi TaxID=1654716 RepID=UPI000A472633|nr:sigma factor-like helix-turn-helix DNA-binding protein [Bradyrhizobium viridifuturi]
MTALSGGNIAPSKAMQSSGRDEPARARREDTSRRRHDREKMTRWQRWNDCSERWGRLMLAAREGDQAAYEQLLRELDLWLRAYFAHRLPYPAADDARQEVLLAIHAKRHTFVASKPFGAWVVAIARYKWVDRIRDASRYNALTLDEDIAVEDHEGAAISAAALDQLLSRLKPAQESVIRLVKLNGLSIARASGATGQSAALVKINIHRGLKKLAAFVS